MVRLLPADLAQWLSSPWQNGVPVEAVTGICHDTRSLKPGHLYVALKGERFDGHQFLKQAFEKGAAGALVSEPAAAGPHPFLEVPDTLDGLQKLARGYRQGWSGTAVGITGSVGKTTVKEMCTSVLSMQGETHCTAGNYNNHIGLPLTMLSMPQDAPFGVFEIGMNHVGEIGPLSELLHPEIGILTDIGSVHREHFTSVEEIVGEKACLIEAVPASGMVLLDRDSPWFSGIRKRASARVVTLGFDAEADYQAHQTAPEILTVNGWDYAMPLPGTHMMRNALRAIALGLELGMQPDHVATGLSRFKLPPMRWEKSDVNGIEFINDAYNASPLSMQAVLRTFADLGGAGGKWLVLGGMRELGDTTDEEHEALGHFIDQLEVDGVITVGLLGAKIVCQRKRPFFQCEEPEEAARILYRHLKPGDSVLLKASRGERIERVLQMFKEN